MTNPMPHISQLHDIQSDMIQIIGLLEAIEQQQIEPGQTASLIHTMRNTISRLQNRIEHLFN